MSQICSFSEEKEFGKYIEVEKRIEYYTKECPFAAGRFKKCESSGYEWESPKNCNLLSISDFIEYFTNRTLILWGDSLNEQLSGSLMCLLSDESTWHNKQTSKFVALMKKRRYCLTISNDINICFLYSTALKINSENALFQDESAVVVANFGAHYSRGKPGKDISDLERSAQEFLTLVTKFKATFIWRETSAQHFPTEDGSFGYKNFKKGHTQYRGYNINNPTKCQHLKSPNRGWRNDITSPYIQNANLNILKLGAFSSSIPPTLHRGGRDCTHFCNPGVTDDWARIIMNYIYAHKI